MDGWTDDASLSEGGGQKNGLYKNEPRPISVLLNLRIP